jgi:large subunit ribosomal protein L25
MTAQSATPTLAATRRAELGRQVKGLRKQGLMPAVMYGHNKASVALTIDQKTFSKLYNEAGSSTLVALKVDDDTPVKVLIHDITIDAVRRIPTHADFYLVNLKEKLRTEIPLTFVGVADAEEILGGTLIHVKSEIEVECLPDDLVHEIEVDISVLKTFEDTLTAADLKIPAGLTLITDPEQTIVSVTEPRSEEEMAALDEAPVAEVETEFETEDGVVDAAPEDEKKKEEE